MVCVGDERLKIKDIFSDNSTVGNLSGEHMLYRKRFKADVDYFSQKTCARYYMQAHYELTNLTRGEINV